MTTNNRNRTGRTHLKTDIRYDVIDNDGNIIQSNLDIVRAKLYCLQSTGLRYTERKYNSRLSETNMLRTSVNITADMKIWLETVAKNEETTVSEIIRRCIQSKMDKRNRFYIPFFNNNRAWPY